MFISERKDVAKEQIKLVATTLNALGIAFMVLGMVRPMVTGAGFPVVEALASVLIGLVFHAIALRALTKLPKDE